MSETPTASAVMGLPEWTVLAVISEQPTYGFAVAQLTTPDGQLGRVWHIPRPVIYRAIGRLTEAELITAQGTEQGHQGPHRTIFAATGPGRDAVSTWLDTPVEHVRDIRSHLLLKLALLHRRGSDASGLIQRQRAALEPIAQAITSDRPQDSFESVLLTWRRVSAAAAITFLNEVSAFPGQSPMAS